jgi:hypothetical protein
MKINEISKYNFIELNKITNTNEIKNKEISSNEVKDKYQKGLNIQEVTYTKKIANSNNSGILTQAEKDFFSKLYPDSANEIRSYQVFSKENIIKGKKIDLKG